MFQIILLTLWLVLTLGGDLMAGYSFLGKVVRYERTVSGINLFCEQEHRVNIEFLRPNMFRVMLVRPQSQEPLLDYPLVETEWQKVELGFEENETELVFESSEIDLVIQKSPCRLKVLDKQGNVINQDDPGMGIGWEGKEICNWKTIADDEKFFGLGEKSGSLNKRGQEWVMWNTDNPHHDNRSDPLYQSIPFFIGMRNYQAYGIYFNNSYRSRFNLGAGNLRYFTFAAESGNLDYFFIYGPEVSKVVETYTELTGRTPMPPKWSLGYQQCRWSYFPDIEVLRIAETFREKEIPADVIYLDIHYMDGYRVFTWDKTRFPDPTALMKTLQDMGFKVVIIIDPGVKVDPEYEIAQEGLQSDHFVKYPDGKIYIGEVWPGASYFPDFSRPATRDWWGEKFRSLLDVGVRGFWNDMNEPAVWGRAFPYEVLFYDEGRISNQKKMHNLYGFLMAQACYDGVKKLRPNQRPFVITRAGFAGEQRFTSMWTGDNQATEEHLEMGIRMLLGLGVSGVPFCGPDVGGFGGTPSPELYARWVESAVFTPFFRTHTAYGTNAQDPWSFGEEVERICRLYINKRYQMLPYLYSLFWEAHQTGTPILRPMFWHDQADPEVYGWDYQEQFYVGEKLLVAPITRVGHTFKKVYLPAGKWLDLNHELVYEGRQTVTVEAPLPVLPMFLRAGAIVPSRETMQFVEEKPLTRLILDVFPATESGEFQYYEDDGESFDYMQGRYRLTEFKFKNQQGELAFIKDREHDQYSPVARSLVIRFHAVSNPMQVQLQGKDLLKIGLQENKPGYYYDEAKKILTVQFKDEGQKQRLMIRT